ncbi:MAG: nucleoside hydrolase, partial [Planctomycetota bacterium]
MLKRPWRMGVISGILLFWVFAIAAAGKEKVLLDSDMVIMLDDGAAMMMLANHADTQLLGVTIVPGNTWVSEGTAYCIRQFEALNRRDIPLAMGVRHPLRPGRYETLEVEQKMYGYSSGYVGCLSRREPASYVEAYRVEFGTRLTSRPLDKHGVNFLIDTIKANPDEVTVLAIGPCTNLAIAIRMAPEIVPLIKRVVYMGGAFD